MATPTKPLPADGGNEFRVADLAVISYEKLLRKDPSEKALLHSACVDWGFFYLDLGGSGTESYLRAIESLFGVAKDYFAKPLEEKLRDTKKDISIFNVCGFKAMGNLGLDAGNQQGKKNGSENIRVPVDALFNPTADPRLVFPEGLKDQRELYSQFIPDSHAIGTTVLASLSDSLGLKDDERFELQHSKDAPSTSSVVLQHYPLQDLPKEVSVGHFTHTDTGSITVLSNSDWGLQVHSPASDQWEYVAPRPNCAIINVGDALKFMSGFKLKSSLHRVVPCERYWTGRDRYACIYFLRPANDAKLVDAEGVERTGREWLEAKFGNYRIPHKEQEKNTISTGKKGFSGLWDVAHQPVAMA